MDKSSPTDKIDLTTAMRRVDLEPIADEKVLAIIPKHTARIFLPLTATFGLAVLMFLILYLIANSPLGGTVLFSGATIVFSLIFGGFFLYLITQWFCLHRSVLIFTGHRVIDINYRTIFSRQVTAMNQGEINNACGSNSPGLGQLFHYGNLILERFDAVPLTVHFVPSPQSVAEQMVQFHNEASHTEIKSPESVSVLNFEAPAEKIGEFLQDLPSTNEPNVTFFAPRDSFEIEAVILDSEALSATDKLQKKGVQRIKKNGRPI